MLTHNAINVCPFLQAKCDNKFLISIRIKISYCIKIRSHNNVIKNVNTTLYQTLFLWRRLMHRSHVVIKNIEI